MQVHVHILAVQVQFQACDSAPMLPWRAPPLHLHHRGIVVMHACLWQMLFCLSRQAGLSVCLYLRGKLLLQDVSSCC